MSSKCHDGFARKLIVITILMISSVSSQSHPFHRAPWANSKGERVLYSHSLLIKEHGNAIGSSSLLSIWPSAIVSHISRLLVLRDPSMIHRFFHEQTAVKEGHEISIVRRFLAVEDLTKLNDVLSEAIFQIPDMDNIQMDLNWPLSAVNISVANLTCSNVHLGSIQLTWNPASQQNLEVFLNILGIEVDCTMNWEFQYASSSSLTSSVGSSGTAQIYFRNSDLAVSSAFLSEDFRYYFPNSFALDSCSANFVASDITFAGSISANVANTFKSLVTSTIESRTNSVICQELDGVDGQVTEMLNEVHNKINKFLPASGWSETDVDPLQTSIVISNDAAFIDFSNGTVGGTLLSQIDSFLSVQGINSMIKSNILNGGDAYDLPVEQFFTKSIVFEGEDMLTKTQIIVSSARVYGLDTITKFDPLNPIAPQILQSSLALKRLDIVADLTVTMNPSTLNTSLLVGNNTPPDVENITVSFSMENIEATVSFFLAVSMSRLGEIQLGSVFQSDQILPCFSQTIDSTEVTQLIANVQGISTPSVTGFISSGLDEVIANATDAAFQTLQPWVLTLIPGFFQETVRLSVNNRLQDFISTETNCAKPSLEGQQEFIDFRDLLLSPEEAVAAGASGMAPYGDMGAKLMQIVDDNFLGKNPDTGLSLINENLIDPFTLSQSNILGTIKFKQDFINDVGNIDIPGLQAHFRLRISDARLNNLDSVGNITFLMPSISDAHRLNNEAIVGTTTKPLEFELKMLMRVTGDQIQLENEFFFKIGVDAAQISTALLAMVDTKTLLTFPLRDIKNPYCWIATMPPPQLDAFGVRLKDATTVSASFVELSASVKKATFGVDCVSCSSPGLDELDKELHTDKGVQESTYIINEALKKLEQIIGVSFLQVQIDRILNEAPMQCPHLSSYDSSFTGMQYEQMTAPIYVDNSGGFVLAVAITVGVFIGLVTVVVLVGKFIASRKHRKWLLSLANKDLQYFHMKYTREERLQAGLNKNTHAMYNSDEVPTIARFMIPIVVLVNIALFLSGQLSLGAAVNIDITLEGQKISIHNFFEFSLLHSTMQMWEGGAYVLALMVAIFSGIWPIAKQVIVLFMWCLPPRLASVQFRGKMFYWLDILGKWSVIDIYILVITMVAFRLSIYSPGSQVSYLSSLYSAEIMIVPKWGLYAMMFAQLISHTNSHFLMHYHREIVDAGMRREIEIQMSESHSESVGDVPADILENSHTHAELPPSNNKGYRKSALRHCVYEVDRNSKKKKAIARVWVDYVLVLTGFIAVILFILGCALPSFRLEFLGLVGVAVEIGQAGANAEKTYSLFQAVSELIDLARYLSTPGDWLGLLTLSLILIFSTCVIPAVQVVAMVLLWFIPINCDYLNREKILFFFEILRAWQYVEVYLLALLVATWQIGGVSKFFFNDVADGALDGFLGSMVYYGILSPDNAQMFYIVANVQLGAYFLFSGSICLALLNMFIMCAEKQRSQQEVREIRENDKVGQKLRANCSDEIENYRDIVNDIKPFPAQCTDFFKWMFVASSVDINTGKETQHASPVQPTQNYRKSDSKMLASPSSRSFASESFALSPGDLNRSPNDLLTSSVFSFDLDSMCCESLDLVRPPDLLSPPKGNDDIASYGDSGPSFNIT